MKWLRIRLNGTCQAGKQVYGRCMPLSPHALIESLGHSVDIGLLTLSSAVVPFFRIGAGLFRPVSFRTTLLFLLLAQEKDPFTFGSFI